MPNQQRIKRMLNDLREIQRCTSPAARRVADRLAGYICDFGTEYHDPRFGTLEWVPPKYGSEY